MFLIRLPKILLLILKFLDVNKIKDTWTEMAIARVICIELWLRSGWKAKNSEFKILERQNHEFQVNTRFWNVKILNSSWSQDFGILNSLS